MCVCVWEREYHSTGGNGWEEEDELFNDGSLRDIAVVDNWDGLITEWTHTVGWLRRKRTLSASMTVQVLLPDIYPCCTHTRQPGSTQTPVGLSIKATNHQRSRFHEQSRGSGVCWWMQRRCLCTCQSTSCSSLCRCGVRIFGSMITTTVSLDLLGPEFNTCRRTKEPTQQMRWDESRWTPNVHPPERSAYLVRVVKRFSITFDRGSFFIPEDKRVGSNETAGGNQPYQRCLLWSADLKRNST